MTGARILVVEDEELIPVLVRAALAQSTDPVLRAARVTAVGGLAQARAVLADGGVDMVLLEVNLPDGSGLALATELQRAGGGRSPTVVALTGAAAGQRRARRRLRSGAGQTLQLSRAV